MIEPVQWVEHVDHFHGTAASRNVGESNDVAEEDRDAVILLGLDLVVRDLELGSVTISFAFIDRDHNLHGHHLLVIDLDLGLFGLELVVMTLNLIYLQSTSHCSTLTMIYMVDSYLSTTLTSNCSALTSWSVTLNSIFFSSTSRSSTLTIIYMVVTYLSTTLTLNCSALTSRFILSCSATSFGNIWQSSVSARRFSAVNSRDFTCSFWACLAILLSISPSFLAYHRLSARQVRVTRTRTILKMVMFWVSDATSLFRPCK